MKVAGLEILRCDAGWRNYHFLKLTTDEGIVGWSEFDEGFGSPGVGTVIERLAPQVVGERVFDHERIYAELYCLTRPAAGGVVGEGLDAIENALLDAKATALEVPCHVLLGGKLQDRVRVYWSHCATWRINHPNLYKPAITSLDGVRAIGAEARDRGFGALKTNVFIYGGGAPQGWRPGFGVPFAPELNVDKTGTAQSARPSRSDPRRPWKCVRMWTCSSISISTPRPRATLSSSRRSGISICSGSKSTAATRRRWRISGAQARTRSARAKPCSACSISCPIFASRRWMSRSLTRYGTGCGNRSRSPQPPMRSR